MKFNLIRSEFYDQKSFFSLGGASAAVWLFTNVLGNVIMIDTTTRYAWIGLILALFISYLAAIQAKKLNLTIGTIAFFNGLLIFVSASGINAINHGIPKNSHAKVNESGVLNFLDKTPWWEPDELKTEINKLREINDSLISSYERRFSEQMDSCAQVTYPSTLQQDSTEFYRTKIELLNLELKNLQSRNQELRNDVTDGDQNNQEKLKTFNNEKAVTVGYLKDMYGLNKKLLESIDEFNKAGKPGEEIRQVRVLGQISERVQSLKSQLKEYNNKILGLAQEIN